MTKTKVKKEKKQPFPIYPIDWGVSKYGVTLIINPFSIPFFDKGCALDVEHDGKGGFVGLGIYSVETNTCYYWNNKEQALAIQLAPFVAHNGVSDIAVLKSWGFNVNESYLMWDTMLMAHIIDSTRRQYGLKKLVKEDLGIEYPSYDDITDKGKKTLLEVDQNLVAEYNACDTYTTYKLYEKQREAMAQELPASQYFNAIEKPISFILKQMGERGINVDLQYLDTLKRQLEMQILPLEQEIKNQLGNLNLNSPKQLLGALNGKGITPQLKSKPSTDKRALESLKKIPIVQRLLDFSEIDTLLSSFVNPYLERNEEVIHPHFNQCGTRTGRPSCSNPNLLQIPKRTENGKRVRRMFISRPGHIFGELDYREGEPRMLAHLSADPAMCQLFINNEGFHSYFAKKLGISRDKAKIFDLETYYRATKFGIARHLNCGLQEAQKCIDEAWVLFPTLYDWEQKIIYEAKKNGYITTLLGRRIKIEGLDNNNEWKRSSAERQCMNNLAQASLQEVIKKAMLDFDKAGITMLIQVYDSLLIEEKESDIENAMNIAIDIMETAVILKVPMEVEATTGKNWGEMK